MIVTVSNESIISVENRRVKHACLACVELEGSSLCASEVPREDSERVNSARLSNYGWFHNICTACELVPIASSEEAGSSSAGLFAKGSGLTTFQWLYIMFFEILVCRARILKGHESLELAWCSCISWKFHVQTNFENYELHPSPSLHTNSMTLNLGQFTSRCAPTLLNMTNRDLDKSSL